MTVPLVVVDVQDGFVNDSSRRCLDDVLRLGRHWRDRGRPVYLTRFVNPPGSQWETLMGWTRLRDAPETDLHPSLAELVPTSTVVDKTSYTALAGQLLADLHAQRWPEVYVCGIATEGCVLKTAVDLFETTTHPVRPVVVSDACASDAGEQVHEMGLHLLSRFLGRDQLVTTEAALRVP